METVEAYYEAPHKEFQKKLKNITRRFKDPLKRVPDICRRKLSDFRLFQENERRRKIAEQEALVKKLQKEEEQKAQESAERGAAYTPVAPAPVVVPPVPKATRTTEGSSSQRLDWTFEVADPDLVPIKYRSVDEKLVRKDVKAGVREIPGVRIYQDYITSFKGRGEKHMAQAAAAAAAAPAVQTPPPGSHLAVIQKVVAYEARDGQKVELSIDIVKNFLVTGKKEMVSSQEFVFFIGVCKARGLNPFAKDCYLIKYSNDPAAIITSIDFYRSRARAQADCVGWEKGVICLNRETGEVRYSKGLVLPNEDLVGGWFKAQPKGWDMPYEVEVNLEGYIKHTNTGDITKFWQPANQPTMIAKVAESQGLRALWPDEFREPSRLKRPASASKPLTPSTLARWGIRLPWNRPSTLRHSTTWWPGRISPANSKASWISSSANVQRSTADAVAR